jgi:hypothetical protein
LSIGDGLAMRPRESATLFLTVGRRELAQIHDTLTGKAAHGPLPQPRTIAQFIKRKVVTEDIQIHPTDQPPINSNNRICEEGKERNLWLHRICPGQCLHKPSTRFLELSRLNWLQFMITIMKNRVSYSTFYYHIL